MKSAIVFGASGQMGYYLVELLRSKEYEVVTPFKRQYEFDRVDNFGFFQQLLEETKPDEIYNLAAINYAPASWDNPTYYLEVNGVAVFKLLELVRRYIPKTKFFQAGSAEVFERATIQQGEDTNRLPDNPYGLAKMLAQESVRIYREAHNLFACTGTFFNAESPRRARTFFAEKVVQEVVKFKLNFDKGILKPIWLGRLDARRDWGWAPEYVEVAWKMLQLPEPMDFVIGTGETHTCREFVAEALMAAGIPAVEKDFDEYVKYDKEFSPVGNCMRALPFRAKRFLNWEAKYKFKDVIRMLVEAEMKCETGLTATTK